MREATSFFMPIRKNLATACGKGPPQKRNQQIKHLSYLQLKPPQIRTATPIAHTVQYTAGR